MTADPSDPRLTVADELASFALPPAALAAGLPPPPVTPPVPPPVGRQPGMSGGAKIALLSSDEESSYSPKSPAYVPGSPVEEPESPVKALGADLAAAASPASTLAGSPAKQADTPAEVKPLPRVVEAPPSVDAAKPPVQPGPPLDSAILTAVAAAVGTTEGLDWLSPKHLACLAEAVDAQARVEACQAAIFNTWSGDKPGLKRTKSAFVRAKFARCSALRKLQRLRTSEFKAWNAKRNAMVAHFLSLLTCT